MIIPMKIKNSTLEIPDSNPLKKLGLLGIWNGFDYALSNRCCRTKFKNKIPFGYLKFEFSPRRYMFGNMPSQFSLPGLRKLLNLLWSNLTRKFKVHWNLEKHLNYRFRPFLVSSEEDTHLPDRRREFPGREI